MKASKLLGVKYIDIDGDSKIEKISLIGHISDENSSYIESLELVIEKHNTINKVFKIPFKGYSPKLFICNLFKSHKNQILIIGQYNNIKAFGILRIYNYDNDNLDLLVDDETLAIQINCYATLEESNKVLVSCLESNKRFIVDINEKKHDKFTPIVSDISVIHPIINPFESFYSLQIHQNVLYASNLDIIATLETIVSIDEKGRATIKNQSLLQYGKFINKK
ncbi:hypothetical protein [Paraclostridium sordellii]|uniref:hypothetical protein n=1 Tax=Paraclostridium sordellii TaxID=1505 RepID=UPI0005E2939C|nr:hypothetical protein [Paeniclostridium sordellii]QYE97119.1 hypothetical protein KZ987_12785 [Paeniclostridium sordellii]CEN79127.1 Uncharacterised protein [[Clostridium] sordellii] [Paeniclostridium sordellii]